MRCHQSQAILVADKVNHEIAKTVNERVIGKPDITPFSASQGVGSRERAGFCPDCRRYRNNPPPSFMVPLPGVIRARGHGLV
jgi:hypothetical protein